jgi:hypothetical protein
MEINPNLNLDAAPFFAYRPFLRYMLGCFYQSIFTCLTSITIYIDPWKSFMKFGIKKPHEMISYMLVWIITKTYFFVQPMHGVYVWPLQHLNYT